MNPTTSPHDGSMPGVPRPRTRGARRRGKTPDSGTGFPLLATQPLRATTPAAATTTAWLPPQSAAPMHSLNQIDVQDEDASRAHADALRNRLLACGMKRSIVHAQLFPETRPATTASRASNQHDVRTGHLQTPLANRTRPPTGVGSSTHTTHTTHMSATNVATANDNKPLVPTLLLPSSQSLMVPSRPMTSSAFNAHDRSTSSNSNRSRTQPHTARTPASPAEQQLHKVPMTARDRYYIEHRATTAPTSSPSTKRRPLRAAPPAATQPTSSNNQERPLATTATTSDCDIARFQPTAAAVELPKRHELLARTDEYKTLTERLAEQMQQQQRSSSSYNNTNNDPIAGPAVPRDSFLYLRRVDSNPYHLALTTHAQSDPHDYFTVSRLGVTHFCHESSEFMAIEAFERENYIYSLIVKLPFFKRYRIWKRFRLWKHALNARKRADAVLRLSQHLFILLPHLHDALLQLRRACLEVLQVHLFAFDDNDSNGQQQQTTRVGATTTTSTRGAAHAPPWHQKTFTLTEFSARLKATKVASERHVDAFIAQVESVAKDACEQYLYAFLRTTGFNESSATTAAAARGTSATSATQVYQHAHFQRFQGQQARTAPALAAQHEARRKSMLAARPQFDPDARMTYTERATMRTQCRRVTQFLRVVEFTVADALLRLAIASTERLRQDMEAIRRDSAVVGRGTSSAKQHAIANKLSGGTTTTTQQPPRIATAPLFRVEVHLESATARSPSIGAIAAHSRRAVGSNARFTRRNLMSPNVETTTSLSTQVTKASELLVFTPDMEALRSQTEALIFSGLRAVTNRTRLLSNAMFHVYVATSLDCSAGSIDGDDNGGNDSGEPTDVARAFAGGESMDLDMLIMEDAAFIETLQGIHAIVMDAYALASARCDALAPFLEQYTTNNQFCQRLMDPQALEHASADACRALLEQYTGEIAAFDALPDAAACGLLLLDSTKLNAVLKPSPRRCLERLHVVIPHVLRLKNERFLQQLSASTDQISAIPTSVDAFAATLAFVRHAQSEMDALDDEYAMLRSLFSLVDDFHVAITDVDQTTAFLVSQKRTQLRTSIELFESSSDAYTTKFGLELDARTPALATELNDVIASLADSTLCAIESAPAAVLATLAQIEQRLQTLEDAVAKHVGFEQTLGLPPTRAFDALPSVQRDLQLKIALWHALQAWTARVAYFAPLQFPWDVDVATIADEIAGFSLQIAAWERVMAPEMHALCSHLKVHVDAYRVTMPILSDLRCVAFEARHFVELEALLGFRIPSTASSPPPPALVDNNDAAPKQQHESLTLGSLVAMRLVPFGAAINRIATEATQERALKATLDKVVGLWEHMAFDVKPYKDSKDAFVLVAFENLYASLEESLVSMTAILSSKYVGPIQDVARTWQRRLAIFQETLDAWVDCQRKWMHLESIFAAPDIQKQLPNEATLFAGVHQFWKDLMRRARDQRNCLKVSGAIFATATSSTAGTSGSGATSNNSGAGHAVLDTMLKHNASLERIEKSLEDYLATKRASFPRFYFIANDELLAILAHAKEPHAVQRHLCKCFDALVKLELSDESGGSGAGTGGASSSSSGTLDIVAMISPEGERVPFSRTLKARGNVEDWLHAVLANMKTAVHRAIKSCLLDYQHAAREHWLLRHPAQAVAIVSYVIWARECEVCFRAASRDPLRELTLWHQTICVQLSNLTRLVRTSLTRLQRSLVVSLVTTDVHFRDVVDDLITKRVVSIDNFHWTQQLRYYWHADNDSCDVLQANCRIPYGYEYMGACTRLVITPLTDRCWMTITGALELRFGAAPSGPAGTGKTETSKDLAKALGILCIVFNCSDQIDYKMMGKIFNGVVQSGSWTCLDEFNRIDIEVLSVVAQQLTVLRHARLVGSHDVMFEGKRVPLREHHVIITMNPGYVGRTELPDNLKSCFRPVAMMVPDYAQIAEILLFAEGFQTAKVLAHKVTKLFKLCSEQLSQQPHYDFGMRSVKAVLTIAGSLKRLASGNAPVNAAAATAMTTSTTASLVSHVDENTLLIRAMVDANIPKLVDDDIVLFRGILRDLFPETLVLATASSSSGSTDDALSGSAAANTSATSWLVSLNDEVRRQLRVHGLQTAPRWQQKIVELFSTLDVRIGVVQTGASGSGKSTALRILSDALTTLRDVNAHPSSKFQRVVSFCLNPKSISMGELYGFFHSVTREWTDGLASSILRACITEKSEQLLHASSSAGGHAKAAAAGTIELSGSHDVASNSSDGPYYWITFDGPIDVLWIESMNTVLDDNKTLCLANGERIKLLQDIHLVFEVLDTASASPATISRLGVVYYHPSHLGWRPFVATWAAALAVPMTKGTGGSGGGGTATTTTMVHLNAQHQARVLQYFELFIDAGLAFVRAQGGGGSSTTATQTTTTSTSASRVPIATSDLTFVTTICHIFQSLLVHRAPAQLFLPASAASLATGAHSTGGGNAAAAAVAALEQQQLRCLDLLFVFSFVWSFGGNLRVDEHRDAFDDVVLTLLDKHESFLSPDLLEINGKIPTRMSHVASNIQDFYIDFTYMSFAPWTHLIQPSVPRAVAYALGTPLTQLLVPTLDVMRYTFLLELLVLDAKKPVLVTGATGAGKTVIVKHLIDARSRDLDAQAASSEAIDASAVAPTPVPPPPTTTTLPILPIHLHFSAQTSSAVTQLSLESKLTKKRKTELGAPPNCDVVVIVIDDINLPTAERHGAQPPIELLRQFLEFRGFYDRDKFYWKDVTDAVLLAIGGVPGGGSRSALCQRFVRHFAAVLCLPSSDDASMRAIFSAILSAHVACLSSAITKSVRDALLQLVDATCLLYRAVARDLLPTPSKCHYLFNLRDVTKLMQGVVLGTQQFCTAESTSSFTSDHVAKLWAHESIRVFRDRLMDDCDRRRFSEHLLALANSILSVAWPLGMIYQSNCGERERDERSADTRTFPPLLFGTAVLYSRHNTSKDSASEAPLQQQQHTYDELSDLQALETTLDAAVVRHNKTLQQQRTGSPTAASTTSDAPQLVLFRDAIVHVVAIARILVQPRGHALLLGMSGSGKRSLTRLAAFVTGFRCHEIVVRKSYNITDFRDDLKTLMRATVVGASSSSTPSTTTAARRSSVRDTSNNNSSTYVSPTVLLLNDAQLVADSFLDDVNTMLSGGEIPKLFTLEEREAIITDVRALWTARAYEQQATGGSFTSNTSVMTTTDASRKDCEDYFVAHVREHLHVVLCLSPVGDTFRKRVRQFPSLINNTTIDVFDAWPRTALEYVANRFLSATDDTSATTGDDRDDASANALAQSTKQALGTLCVEMHRSVDASSDAFLMRYKRRVFVTPQHFLDLIALFQRICATKRALLDTKLQRLTTGVVRLEETRALVHTLQDELVALQPELLEKAREAEQLLAQVSVDQAEATTVAARVALDEREVQQQQREVAACQVDAQTDLDAALPALQAAVTALDALDKKDITEVKGFVKPPQAVQVVMEAVCIMLGEKPDWDTSKRVLSRSTFMVELKEYDKDAIAPATLKRIRKYIESPEFAVDEVKKVSRAAMSLCMWVHAIDTYARVHKDVAPKRQRLAELNATLADANATLAAKQLELQRVVESVRVLKATCDATLAEKQRLVDESELTQARLERAEKLTEGLRDERVRWKRSIEELRTDALAVVGNSFLAAASVAYLGPFDALFRAKLIAHWLAFASTLLTVSPDFTLVHACGGDAMALREWQLLGLPSDAVSAENAICIMQNSERWPLLIDPQQQASQWIKRMEAPYDLVVVKSSDLELARVVEACLACGTPLLIEDVPETMIEPTLEPILNRAALTPLRAADAIASVRFGGRLIDVDTSRFRLYLTTKLANPEFTPDVFIRMSVINFTVTRAGLEDQLLSDVVKRERPEVEARKSALVTSIANDQKLLQQLEVKILSLLSESSGNILDDVELIRALETSKQTSTVVLRRLHESEATKLEVLEIRDQYTPVAARGALLYFVIADLARLDPMYQNSLEYFSRLFNASIDEAPVAKVASTVTASTPATSALTNRLTSLTDHLTFVVYRNICRGLFEAHKLLFALLVCLRVQVMDHVLEELDVHLLDAAAVQLDTHATTTPGSSSAETTGSSSDATTNADALDVVDVLVALGDHCAAFTLVLDAYRSDPHAWKSWLASLNPYHAPLPSSASDANEKSDIPPLDLSAFHRLVLVRWLRADAFVDAATAYIATHLGARFVETESLAMRDVFRDMDSRTPCLFVLSSGADPKRILDQFARDCGVYDTAYHVISLGQGQGPVAEALIDRCMRDGDWLALLNVHLAKSWLPRFQQLLAAIDAAPPHDNYRLFLASFPATYFPIVILQNSVKIICEPPRGIKANLRRSMALLTHHLDSSSGIEDDKSNIGATNANTNTRAASAAAAAAAADDARRATLERQLAFGLLFFHAVIHERAKFGTLGWNLAYGFSDADLLSVLALQRRLLRGAQRSHHDRLLARQGSMVFDVVPNDQTDDSRDADDGAMQHEHWAVPWDALYFLTAEIYYGGRVTDEFDRRCLMANLLRFCSAASLDRARLVTATATTTTQSDASDLLPQLFALEKNNSSTNNRLFCCPTFPSDAAMTSFIDALPPVDAPFVFGMHPNAHIYYQKQETERLVGALALVQPFVPAAAAAGTNSSSDKSSNEDPRTTPAIATTTSIAPVDSVEAVVVRIAREMQATLPVPSAIVSTAPVSTTRKSVSVTTATPSDATTHELVDPFAVVLHQELSKCHALLQFVHERLDAVIKAIQGVVVMSHCIEDVVHSLAVHHVPLEWRNRDGSAAMPPTTTASAASSGPSVSHWTSQLLFRFEFLHAWQARGAPPHNVFPLAIFCFPQGFFTAILQRHARKYRVPIHHLVFQFRVVDARNEMNDAQDDAPSILDGTDDSAAVGGASSEQESDAPSDRRSRSDVGDAELPSGVTATADGAFISGMFLEGARWCDERHVLCDPLPGVMHHSMPIIHVLPQAMEDRAHASAATSLHAPGATAAGRAVAPAIRAKAATASRAIMQGTAASTAGLLPPVPQAFTYACPVYKTPARKGTMSTTGISTNFVLAIELPCERPPEHYALNGTALVCTSHT